MSTPSALVLEQYNLSAAEALFRDANTENKDYAYKIRTRSEKTSNLILSVGRESDWAAVYNTVGGPDVSWLFFGPDRMPGWMNYGNDQNHQIKMTEFVHRKKSDTSRYFSTLNGKSLKWRFPTETTMECVDGRTQVAFWERVEETPESPSLAAKLTINAAYFLIITEVMTSLTLNRLNRDWCWEQRASAQGAVKGR